MEVIFTLSEIKAAAQKVYLATTAYKIFAFHGEMGAGKTTFVNAFCEALGVMDNISSPTYSIINQYKTKNDQTVYHIDLYRLKDETEAINAGVEDCFFSGNICLVEWPNIAAAIFPDDTLHINITSLNATTRKLSYNN